VISVTSPRSLFGRSDCVLIRTWRRVVVVPAEVLLVPSGLDSENCFFLMGFLKLV